MSKADAGPVIYKSRPPFDSDAYALWLDDVMHPLQTLRIIESRYRRST